MKIIYFGLMITLIGNVGCGVKGKPQAPLEKTYIGNSQLPKRK